MRSNTSFANRRRGGIPQSWAVIVHPMPPSLDPGERQEFVLLLDVAQDAVVALHTVARSTSAESLWQHINQAWDKTPPHRHPARLSIYPPELLPALNEAPRDRRLVHLELLAQSAIPESVRLLLDLPAAEPAPTPEKPAPAAREAAPPAAGPPAGPPPPPPSREGVRTLIELPRYNLTGLKPCFGAEASVELATAALDPALIDSDMWEATDLDAEALEAEATLQGFTLRCAQPAALVEALLVIEEVACFDAGSEQGPVTVLVAFGAGRLLGALGVLPRGWISEEARGRLHHAAEWLEGASLLALSDASGALWMAHPVRFRGSFDPGAHFSVLEPAARLLVRRRRKPEDEPA